MIARIRKAETTGRPLGDAPFVDGIADMTGTIVKPGKQAPKPKGQGSVSIDNEVHRRRNAAHLACQQSWISCGGAGARLVRRNIRQSAAMPERGRVR